MTIFAKGHGTENDFVLLDDPDGRIDLTPDLIRRLADRRSGLGGDGVIRVVRTAAATSGQTPLPDGPAEWFMDYWNCDGSPAEMCGNGLRVFAAYLRRRGRVAFRDGEQVPIATRGGVKLVSRHGELFSFDVGGWQLSAGPGAVAAGGDVEVTFPGMPPLPGLSVDLSNPHVVVVLPDVESLDRLDLTSAPIVEPAPVNGTNVEIVVPLHDQSTRSDLGHLRMRVHERGSGETRSCGTGVVAAALAARAWGGGLAPDHWRVDVPGGTLYVDVEGTASEGNAARLTGPAVIVAEGDLVDEG